MVSKSCFTLGYLQKQGGLLKVSDLRNLEKCILALELTSRLQKGGLDFIFKGGTSLLLHCETAKRLSIDVDILSLEPLEKFEEVLGKITGTAPFGRWAHQDHRDREAPPTKHFKAFYTSAINGDEDSIQLDVICAENPYAKVIDSPVNASFLEIEEETLVRLPSASCLLADKVAAFAPTTIGFLYFPMARGRGAQGEPRPIKVIKHLYDIGILADLADDTESAIATYAAIHAEQLRFRGIDHSVEEALLDTQTAAYHVCRLGGKKPDAPDALTLQHRDILGKGISALESHLFSEPFRQADSQIAAAKAALAAQMISSKSTDFNLAEFLATEPDLVQLRAAELVDPWVHISQPLKKGNAEAFRIWLQAQVLRG